MVFSFQNNPENLDQTCKRDLEMLDCFGSEKVSLNQINIAIKQLDKIIIKH